MERSGTQKVQYCSGVSTRNYRQVLPEMAQTVGVSKSAVSREFVDASGKALRELAERRFDEKDISIVNIDGIVVSGRLDNL